MHPEAGHFVMLILSPSKRPGAAVRAQHPTGLSAVQTQHDKFTWSAGISDFQVTPTVFLTSATCRLSAVKLPFSDGKIRVFVCCVLFLFHSHKEPKKLPVVHTSQSSELVVTYFFCGEEIPYRRMLKAQSLTLGHFKEQLSKKGNYR